MGAINKNTNEYVYLAIANKEDKYKCPDCDEDLIFVRGKIYRPHFRHKINSVCKYYDHPNESQLHKDAKLLLKKLLDTRKCIIMNKECSMCDDFVKTKLNYSDDMIVELEYGFDFNGQKYADVACTQDNKLVYIFEICHTHATDEQDRPEPWFEINAYDLVTQINKMNVSDSDSRSAQIEPAQAPLSEVSNTINIRCTRNYKCNYCTTRCLTNSYLDGHEHFDNIYLNVPFDKKDVVKNLGARWNQDIKKWWVTPNNNNYEQLIRMFTTYDVKKHHNEKKVKQCATCGVWQDIRLMDTNICNDICKRCDIKKYTNQRII